MFLSQFLQEPSSRAQPLVAQLGYPVREIIIVGTKRAIFSNEAGVGTEALAHSTAKTDEPVREGLVGMLGPILDTHLICTATAMVILTSNTQSATGILAVSAAFEQTMPGFGTMSLTWIFLAFGFSTLVTYAFYSQRCAKYLLGNTLGEYYLWVYLFFLICLLYTSPSPRDPKTSRMPSSA